jgi:hypothetical protein
VGSPTRRRSRPQSRQQKRPVLTLEERQARVAEPADASTQQAEPDHAEPRREARPPHPADRSQHAEPGADHRGGSIVRHRQDALERAWDDRSHRRDGRVDRDRRAYVPSHRREPEQPRPAGDENGNGERSKRQQRRRGRLVGDEGARHQQPDLALAGTAGTRRQRGEIEEPGPVRGRHAADRREDGEQPA